jgi:hypothetical protein
MPPRGREGSAARRGWLALLLAVGTAPFLISSGLAQAENPGSTALSILRLPAGARPIGMGGAFTAMEDLYSMWYNPAGIASIRRVDVSGLLTKGLGDTSLQHLAVAAPMPFGFVTDEYPAVLGFGAMFASEGSIDVTTLDGSGNAGPTSTLNAGRDMVLSATFAQHVFDDVHHSDGKLYLNEHLFGATVKYIRSTLVENYTAQSVAVDIGYMYKLPEYNLNLGASVLNLGSPVKYDTVGDPLPTSIRGGFGYKIPFPLADSHVTFTGDIEHFTNEVETRKLIGVEYVHERFFSARGGWRFGDTLGGPTFGVGFHASGIEVDYGFMVAGDLSSSHRISVTMSFDTPWKTELTSHKLRWEQILEAPSLQEMENRQLPDSQKKKDEDSGNPNSLPLVPGWVR